MGAVCPDRVVSRRSDPRSLPTAHRRPLSSWDARRSASWSSTDHKNLIFRETDVIGHPVSSLSGIVSGTGYLCQSQTTSFYPYFLSGLDALSWRMEIPEMFYPASLIPGLREIGTWPLQTWGGKEK